MAETPKVTFESLFGVLGSVGLVPGRILGVSPRHGAYTVRKSADNRSLIHLKPEQRRMSAKTLAIITAPVAPNSLK